MEVIYHKADQYAQKYSSQQDELLQQVEKNTSANHPHPHMLSGQVQGKLLEMISTMIRPLNILEIGTFTGYSALCLAKGMQQNGVLHTIELREEDAATAQKYFDMAQPTANIQLHVGDALAIIPTLDIEFDLVFIDADKVNYINYYGLTLPKVKKGGWIIADNVLFHGQVLADEIKGKNAKAIQSFNEHVLNDSNVQQVMLTVRDGLLLIQKL
ncbi:MAG: O-methyltransferase [Chitinophagaceae bacterium]|nr:O-methyltransferase [Chitinophagaceae bacterium]